MTRASLARRYDLAAIVALLLAVLVLFGRRAWHGMHFPHFGDESMHFVGAQVLSRGGILYRNFIELHGPLAYALPQLYGAIFGWAEPLHARIIPLGLTLAAAAAIAASASLRGAWERVSALAIFLGLTSTVWLVQSLCLYDYQPPAGALLLICVALFVVPAWCGAPAGRAALFTAGFCAALTPFIAFSYGPAALLFLASGAAAFWLCGRARALGMVAAGGLAACALMLAWLIRYADFHGYLVFHFIHAIVDFGPYLHFGAGAALSALWQPIHRDTVVEAVGTAFGLAALLALAAAGAARRWHVLPFLLGAAGLVMVNPRGSPGFQNGGYMIVSFGFVALTFAALPRRLNLRTTQAARLAWAAAMGLGIVGAEAAARQASSSPHAFVRKQLKNLPPATLAQSDEVWARRVRQVTDPDERILAVPFDPGLYLLAGRLPMNRYVYYLPWDADYAKHPWLGLDHDLCGDLRRDPPPVIYYDGLVVWGHYDPARYMACLQPILAGKYRPMPDAPFFFVRADRMARLSK
jgi:hypothetical protein